MELREVLPDGLSSWGCKESDTTEQLTLSLFQRSTVICIKTHSESSHWTISFTRVRPMSSIHRHLCLHR